jgi:hypothetical protein
VPELKQFSPATEAVFAALDRLDDADFAVLEPHLAKWLQRAHRYRRRNRAIFVLAACYPPPGENQIQVVFLRSGVDLGAGGQSMVGDRVNLGLDAARASHERSRGLCADG